jgi:hypothetical protein
MNCYAGLAKRLIKSCFPEVIPVPQLEPLDAKNIIKQDMMDVSINKFKPISDEEAWAVTVAWAEAKAKEREAKEETQTDTDESYDSDDSEFGVSTHPVKKSGLFAHEDEDTVKQLVRSIIAQWVTTSKKWYAASTIQAVVRGRLVRSGAHKFFNFTDFYNAYYLRKTAEARQCWWVTTYTLSRTALAMATLWNVEKRAATIIQAVARGMCCRVWLRGTRRLFLERRRLFLEMRILLRDLHDVEVNIYLAATIIQATARGRAVRAWKAQFIDGLAVELVHIHRMRYLKRDSADWSWWFEALMLENTASPKCAMAWIKLAERRRYDHHFCLV